MIAITTYIWCCLWSFKSGIINIPANYHVTANLWGWEAHGSVEIIGLSRKSTSIQLCCACLCLGYVSSGSITLSSMLGVVMHCTWMYLVLLGCSSCKGHFFKVIWIGMGIRWINGFPAAKFMEIVLYYTVSKLYKFIKQLGWLVGRLLRRNTRIEWLVHASLRTTRRSIGSTVTYIPNCRVYWSTNK